MAPPTTASAQDVADKFRTDLDAIHQAATASIKGAVAHFAPDAVPPEATVDAATQAAQDAIRQRTAALGGNDVGTDSTTAAQMRGQRAREVIEQIAGAANTRLGNLWDIVRQHGLTQFDDDGIGEAARNLPAEIAPREGQPKTTLGFGRFDGPIVDTLADWKGPIDLDVLRGQQSDISSKINEAAVAGDRQAVRRLEILKGAVDDALDHGIVSKVQEQNQDVAAGKISPADTMEAQLASNADKLRDVAISGERPAAAVADSGQGAANALGMGSVALPGAGGTASAAAPGRGNAAWDQGLAGTAGVSPESAVQAYADARAATREYHSVYGDKTPTGAILKKGPFGGGHAVQDSTVLGQYFMPGDKGAEPVQNLVAAVGKDKAREIIGDQAAASLRFVAAPTGRLGRPRFAAPRRLRYSRRMHCCPRGPLPCP